MLTRYTASRDNTITNAFDSSMTKRGTRANMGASDSIEIFYIVNQAYLSSSEKSRALLKFDVDKIQYDRTVSKIPSSGSVNFYLKLFNIEHASTLPRDCTLSILPVSQSWDEGGGLDMEEYTDLYSSNWYSASSTSPWNVEGGDFLSSPVYSYNLHKGNEDIILDITGLVEKWIDGTIQNNGVCVKLSGNFETGSESYYTKKFSSRGTEYFFNRPVLEARWDSSSLDNRANFYVSNSLADSQRNKNNLYLINKIRGKYTNIPNFESQNLIVQLHDTYTGSNSIASYSASKISTGIYTSSVVFYTTASVLYDKWFVSGSSTCYFTGTINIGQEKDVEQYYSKITNLKSDYSNNEIVDFRVFTRAKNWHPTVYTKAQIQIVPDIVENLHYSIIRVADNLKAIEYDVTNNSTKLSYDVSGSYFSLNTSLLEEDYLYEIRFKRIYDSFEEELPEKFRFRIRKESE